MGSSNTDHFGVKIWKYCNDAGAAKRAFDMQDELHADGLAPPVGEIINVSCTNNRDTEVFPGLTTAIAMVAPQSDIRKVIFNDNAWERCDSDAIRERGETTDIPDRLKDFMRECSHLVRYNSIDQWCQAWWRWVLQADYKDAQAALRSSLIR